MVIMPLQNRYLPPLMILLFISWLNDIYSGTRDIFRGLSAGKILFLLFLSLFIWQLAGLLYSENNVMAWRNVSSRLAFVLFPLVLFNQGEKIRDNRKILFRLFAAATAVYLLSCYLVASYRSFSLSQGSLIFNPHPSGAEWENYFFNDLFTYSIHPSYLSMYAIMAFLFAVEAARGAGRRAMIAWTSTALFIFVSLYFISSRAALLSMILIVPIWLINIMTGKRRPIFIVLILVSAAMASIPFIMSNERYKSLIPLISERNADENSVKDDRFIIWNSALRVLKNSPVIGVGLGDVRDELVKVYDSMGEERLSQNKTNAHNQFLEIFLESGIPGILLFLAIFVLMAFRAVKSKDLLYIMFIFMTLTFFMFESVLYRFAGISFFSLFAFLLLPQPKKE